MFEIFRQYLVQQIPLSEQELERIAAVSRIKKLRRRQYLLQEGDVWRYNAFVCEGCLRTYRVNEQGTEHILSFAIENWWTGDRESLLTGQPSKSNIEAIEDSTLLLIGYDEFEELKNTIPAFMELVTALLERRFIVSQNRIHANISQTAEERYRDFIHTYPQITSRIPQHMVASYLGMSPETLSRIRKQAAGK